MCSEYPCLYKMLFSISTREILESLFFMSCPSNEIQCWKYQEVSGSSYKEVLGINKLVGPQNKF
jgi:hypothetical protein